jgi:WXG100 family type VII secretion target
MKDQVRVTSPALEATAKKFQNDVEAFDASTTNLQNAVSNLEATWSGLGYDTFAAAMVKWDKDMKVLGVDLFNLAQGVEKSGVLMENVDQDIQRAFTPFANM